VMPGTLRSASFSDAAACVSSIFLSSTVIDCGTSRSGVSNLAPVAVRLESRSSLAVALIGGRLDSVLVAGASAPGASCAWAAPKTRASVAARRL